MTHEVLDKAEKFFKMRRTRLRSGTRVRQYVEARQMITAVLREDYKLQWAVSYTHLTLPTNREV